MAKGNGVFERDSSCLVVIDVQAYFLGKLPLHERRPLIERIAWLMRVARALDIPIVATAEDIARNGTLVPELVAELPTGAPIHDKMIFGLDRQDNIRAAVQAAGRQVQVLVGMETDVCVAHSALGLAALGLCPVVIADASASPPPHHEHGLRRLRDAGVAVTSAKGIYYEWVRDLATHRRIEGLNDPLPAGLTL